MIHCMYQSLESVPPTFWNGLSPLQIITILRSINSRISTKDIENIPDNTKQTTLL